MPLIGSRYTAPWGLSNPHLQTILPTLLRNPPEPRYQRIRLDTPDGDFIDIDRASVLSRSAVIFSHGLEGHSRGHYVLAGVNAMLAQRWDCIAWNFRGCSGCPNRLLPWYHSGKTEDLRLVIDWAIKQEYERIVLVGYSVGGNITLKYLGEQSSQLPHQIISAVSFSVPCDLAACAQMLARPGNALYMRHFLRSLRLKVLSKMAQFPGKIDDSNWHDVKSFREFDARYTAPLNGYASVEEYWNKNSCRPLIPKITIPTLLLQAGDDPFFSASCYPRDEAFASQHFHLETTLQGGHLGFIARGAGGFYFPEIRMVSWLKDHGWIK